MTALSDLLNTKIPEKFGDASNRDLSKLAGISRGTVDNYRNGKHPATPSEDVLSAFHRLLGIPIQELRAAAGLPLGEAELWEPPAEAQQMTTRQREAVDELIRSIVATRGATHADQPDRADPPASTEDSQDQASAREKTWTVLMMRPLPGQREPTISVDTIKASTEREATDFIEGTLQIAGFTTERKADRGPARVDLAARNSDGPLLVELVRGSDDRAADLAEERLSHVWQAYINSYGHGEADRPEDQHSPASKDQASEDQKTTAELQQQLDALIAGRVIPSSTGDWHIVVQKLGESLDKAMKLQRDEELDALMVVPEPPSLDYDDAQVHNLEDRRRKPAALPKASAIRDQMKGSDDAGLGEGEE